MKTMQEILEGLNAGTLDAWRDACAQHKEGLLERLKNTHSLVHLTEIHNQFHTTKWALGQIETELKRRDELADANRKRLGLDQPDLGESLWLEGYGKQLDPDQERRQAELNKINRKRVGLPPFAKIPVKEKEGEQTGWVELETIVHIDGEAIKEGAVVSMVRKHQESKAKRVCGNCVRRIETPEYPYGWCTWGSFLATVNGAGPEHCGNFDPLPLPQTPPSEAVEAAESLINVCANCNFHSHKQDPMGFCAKLGCKMPPTNPVDPCVHFRSKPASERAVAAPDALPTPEEFDPNDPRR